MSDETAQFHPDVNDEDDNWYIYEDNANDKCVGSESNIVNDDVKPNAEFVDYQYEEDERELEGDVVGDSLVEAVSDTDELSKHNLILKEIINEKGLKTQSYYCQECCEEYSDINEFLQQHPGVQLLNENPEDFIAPETNNTQDKLWDLVEDLKEESDEINAEFIAEPNPQNIVEQERMMTPLEKTEPAEFEQERYFCYECQQVFTDLSTAEEHDCTQLQQQLQQQEQHEDNQIKEEYGEDEEGEEDDYIIDESQKFIDFACAYCSTVFSSYDDLLNHISNCQQNVIAKSTTTPDGIIYHCDMCNKNYNSLKSYTNHQRLHKKMQGGKIATKTGPASCEICNTQFASTRNLRLHMKMHKERVVKTIQEALPAGAHTEYNELNQFYCEICNKSFDQRLLTIHKNMHQNVEEYNCSRCNKQFENLLSYDMHMQMHAENKLNGTKKPDLNVLYQNTSQTTRKHACQYCSKEFQRPYEKVKHERIHTGEKPYNCEVCGKSFRVSYSLTLHLRTHTDIRPYVCATCNKRFKQQSVYVHHLKTHIAERHYKCDECGKSFRTSVQLNGHKNSHSKPFNCIECNRPFASLYAVKVHMKTHSKGHKSNKTFKNRCEICGASYARIFALRYHLKEQHGLDIDPGQLLDVEDDGGTTTSSKHLKALDAETSLLMSAAKEAKINKEFMEFIDNSDCEDLEDECGAKGNVIKRYDGNNLVMLDDDLAETEAATQTILQAKQEISEHNFQEEIITDW